MRPNAPFLHQISPSHTKVNPSKHTYVSQPAINSTTIIDVPPQISLRSRRPRPQSFYLVYRRRQSSLGNSSLPRKVSILSSSVQLITSLPSASFRSVRTETLDTPNNAWTHSQNYASSQGFAVMTGQCGKADP